MFHQFASAFAPFKLCVIHAFNLEYNTHYILEMMLQHGLDLNKMEGHMTLKEKIESFEDDEMNRIIQKYYHK